MFGLGLPELLILGLVVVGLVLLVRALLRR